MKESPFLREIMNEGREQGREQGREEGREEGRGQGRQEARREDLLLLLRERFGEKATRRVEGQVEQIGELDRLEELFKHGLRSRTFDEFRAALDAPERPQD